MKYRRLKIKIRLQVLLVREYKKEVKKIFQSTGGSHTSECYDYEREREKLRVLHLLNGFSRGRKYSEMERTARSEPDWRLFRELAMEYVVSRPVAQHPRWIAQKEEISRGPSRIEGFKAHVKARMGDEFEGASSPGDWIALARRIYPRGGSHSHRIDPYLRMEEWVLDARKHFFGQPLSPYWHYCKHPFRIDR